MVILTYISRGIRPHLRRFLTDKITGIARVGVGA